MKFLVNIIFGLCTTCRQKRSRTVRYAFPMVFAAMAFLGAQALVSVDKTYISVEPSTSSLKAGDAFHFDVYVTAHTPINAIYLEIGFSDDQVKITGIDTGESVITLWTEDPYVEGNKVHLRGGTFRRGFVGEHLIATVNAKALDTGVAQIEVTDALLLAGDGAGTEVTTDGGSTEKAKVYIASEDGSYVPTASTAGGELSGTVNVRVTTDIDGDGDVSLQDLSRFMTAWASKSSFFDFSGDGKMTFRDFGIILSDSFFK